MSDSIGFVAVFSEVFTQEQVGGFVESWLKGFGGVEQVCPGRGGTMTLKMTSEQDVLWESAMQFRVTEGADFAWVYLSLGRRVIETTGLAGGERPLVLEVLMDLPGLEEVIDQHNERRLDELEEEGLL